MAGWIKLHRKLTEWEWYSDINTSRLFLHLLLVANHKDGKWRGMQIKRGQRLTSISNLALETNLSVKNIRTAVKKLKSTNEVASVSTSQHTVFTVINYDFYQEMANEGANKGQTRGKQGATNKNEKNEKNEKNNKHRDDAMSDIFDHWIKTMGKSSRVKFSDNRKECVSARLKDYTAEQIKTAITSCANSAYHMGHNRDGTIYDDLTLICRNPEKLDAFITNAERNLNARKNQNSGGSRVTSDHRLSDDK